MKAFVLPLLALAAAGCQVNVDDNTAASIDNAASSLENVADSAAAGLENTAESAAGTVENAADRIGNANVDVDVGDKDRNEAASNKQ
jgi:hypothetical protein